MFSGEIMKHLGFSGKLLDFELKNHDCPTCFLDFGSDTSRHITDFSLVSAAPPLSCSSVSIIFFLPLVLIFCVASLSLCCCFLLWLFSVFALFSSVLLTRFSLPVPRDVPHAGHPRAIESSQMQVED